MSFHEVGDQVSRLIGHTDPEVRAIGARLAGLLELAQLRPSLKLLAGDTSRDVQEAALAALKQINPTGGRETEIMRPHGGYAGLKAHEAAEIAYDATVAFCNRFISLRSRTHDQMVQAARSGKQNIVEGSAAAGTSSKTELRLIGVARASFEEVLADYKDFLRQRQLQQWAKDDPQAQEIRKMAYLQNRSYKDYRTYIEEGSPEIAANCAICLVFQATFLLDRLKKRLEQDFLEHGGVSERMLAARLKRRNQQA
jgi:restriction system protein